ncbi:hypothetical protein GCM10025882_05570 [Acinetobacter gyllenbergii]|nr:hypothetical protein GCM10025882_05570 [Acinetobacter gyllenbergii]
MGNFSFEQLLDLFAVLTNRIQLVTANVREKKQRITKNLNGIILIWAVFKIMIKLGTITVNKRA